jgi:hypothetical protein
MADKTGEDKSLRRRVVITAGTVVLAGVTAFVVGLATHASDSLTSSPDKPKQTSAQSTVLVESAAEMSGKLISASASEDGAECVTGLYAPAGIARSIMAAQKPPVMATIQRMRGVALVDRDAVTVSIQGTSARTITLTGITFHVTRSRPPTTGATFSRQCGGPTIGRTLVANLDDDPPRIVDSNALEDVPLGQVQDGKSATRPIRFPWTVSVTDSLLLHIIATTKRCSCAWTAELPWVSGGAHGTIRVNDHGAPFEVTAVPRVKGYLGMYGRWIDADTL